MDSALLEKVRQVLETAGWDDPVIEVVPEGSRVVATVTSPSFDGVGEAERQARVWDVLQAGLSSEDHSLVDLVVARTPAEQAA